MKLVFLLHLVVWTMCCVHCKIWGMRFVCSKLTSVGHFLYPVDLAAAIHLGIKWDDKYYIEKHLAFFTFIYTFWDKMQTIGLFVCLFGVLRRFQHCTGHITTGSWKGRGNQYI